MHQDIEHFIKGLPHWQNEVKLLRDLILATKLQEEVKWGKPCYTFEGKNITIIQPFKNFIGLMFFQGSLLEDPKKTLKNNGPNSQAARRLEFRSLQQISQQKSTIKSYLLEAIKLRTDGIGVKFKRRPEPIPHELQMMFKKEPDFKLAFHSLTPGRQRAYILYFSAAKQSQTRISRIEKNVKKILAGIGLTES